eukprot:351323-Pyramimonas_sp.AAC.2
MREYSLHCFVREIATCGEHDGLRKVPRTISVRSGDTAMSKRKVKCSAGSRCKLSGRCRGAKYFAAARRPSIQVHTGAQFGPNQTQCALESSGRPPQTLRPAQPFIVTMPSNWQPGLVFGRGQSCLLCYI